MNLWQNAILHTQVQVTFSPDAAQVPLEDSSVDVAIFSLSLMGTNYIEYIAEAYRVLKPK
jgi:ubiquinone/menaquinone biosynthesis C-methylase UbiE